MTVIISTLYRTALILYKKTGYLLAGDPAHELLNLPSLSTSAAQTLMGQWLIHHLSLLESNSHPSTHTWLKLRNPVKDLIFFICYGPECKPIHAFISTTKAEPETMNLNVVNHYLVVQIAAVDMLYQYIFLFDIKMRMKEESLLCG